ncbi:hypothetical protein LEP1GSC059_3959 [Leptospira noguchii serovar Panama str. CZ214]|uniref:Uncharacterized protein n=1 Tax=Leptospira noguchii serovar Panama str. CZ214 TaxID=1001595 RepID=T0H3B0_9LEPT|nr:hypothetical protein LEP1GSC059_3959 [Leptospira noguchii serovar Panama str. CZ214]
MFFGNFYTFKFLYKSTLKYKQFLLKKSLQNLKSYRSSLKVLKKHSNRKIKQSNLE